MKWTVLLLLSLCACEPTRPRTSETSASSGGASNCVLTGRWRMRSSGGCSESVWTFEAPATDGSIQGTEVGCGGVRATGRWRGGRFELEGVTTDSATSMVNYQWRFDASCSNATGTISFGSEQRDAVSATLEPAP